MLFKWYRKKASINLKKHGIDFQEAKTVFTDEWGLHYPDALHSIGEPRYLCYGRSNKDRYLVVVYTEPAPDVFQLISAREMTRKERMIYEGQSGNPR
jgi:uncharacterized DUF497 family protein